MQKMPKNGQKQQKLQKKSVKMKIDPYSSPKMLKITSDGKEQAENTHKQPDLVGWVKITQKME